MKAGTTVMRVTATFIGGISLLVLFSFLPLSGAPVARAQAVTPPGITLVPGTVTLGDPINHAILSAIQASGDLYPDIVYFAVTDWRRDGDWGFASVMGLAQVHDGSAWSIDDSAWTGIVILQRGADGSWQGATQGTTAFSSLLDSAPDTFIDASAKRNLDPLQASGMQTEAISSFTFPLKPGTLMYYGSLGVHANGFAGVVNGWKAVDLLSDGDTTLNHAPNRLLASEAGTISYVCKDSVNVAVKVADFFYTHLVYNENLFVGKTFAQGDYMGSLKTGSFSANCGHADQPANWFHVHWGFPNTDLHVEDWTLSISTENWTNGTTTVTPGSWMLAGPTPPMPANLRQTGATPNDIELAWDASTGAEGYYVYSWDGSSYVLQDTLGPAETSYTELRGSCGWSELYKVSAYNYIGQSQRAGPLQAYTIPCTPALLSPANGSVQAWNYDVTFQASPDGAATGYLVEYWSDPSSPLTCGWSSSASCHAGAVTPGKTYSWHMKARSPSGETGWSTTWTFTVQPIPCYTLALTHSGSGMDPLASPANTGGCSAGHYHPGETITLSATPDTGWSVGSWSGTDHNSSTSTTNTLTMPDSDNASAVNYTPIIPGVPALVSPAKKATWQPIDITLDWNAASGALSYEYCISTSTTCTNWVPTGTDTDAALFQLGYGTTYYWQVRATNEYGNHSLSARWYFTTGSKPAAFNKSFPANGAVGQRADLHLQWTASAGADEYQYCIDTVNDGVCQDGKWISTGAIRSADLSGTLTKLTTYYWQVRAVNGFGSRVSGGGWWSFKTAGVPGPFLKESPADLSSGVAVSPVLEWSASRYATQYQYCIDQTDDSVCDGDQWLNGGSKTSKKVGAALQPLTTYYWQMRAVNGFGMAVADGGTWRSFTTGQLPASFGKSGPLDGALDQGLGPSLAWSASMGATSYTYCLSTTSGQCGLWISTGSATSVNLRGLTQHTTYYWQVRAINSVGIQPADGGAWWSFTSGYLPGSFSKLAPAYGATGVSLTPTLSWQSSAHAAAYAYCIGTSSTCTTWTNAGSQTSVAVSVLQPGTLYYWQVRARNPIGYTYAAGGPWPFRTGAVPGSFSKISPANGSASQSASGPLTWGVSTGATRYEFCLDTVNDGLCQGQSWIRNGLQRTADLSGLALIPNTRYYWQVRAVNSFGTRVAGGGWWSFTTAP